MNVSHEGQDLLTAGHVGVAAPAIPNSDGDRLLTRAVCERLMQRTKSFAQGGGATRVGIEGWWNGELRWARNRTSLAGDRRDIRLSVRREQMGGSSVASTNQLDDASLEATVRAAERNARLNPSRAGIEFELLSPEFTTPDPTIWSDATYKVSAEQRGALARALITGAEARDMLSAGYAEMRIGEVASLDAKDTVQYVTFTQAQCSMTVRHPKGTGSGWAGLSSYDWSSIDPVLLASRALEKCLASLDPVRIEPGRYTVILEPQAVCDLAEILVRCFNRAVAEGGKGPFALEYDRGLRIWRTKLGLQIIDERITIDHDPLDPLLGILPYAGLERVTWIDKGILQSMAHFQGFWVDRRKALGDLNENMPVVERLAFRMSGGDTPTQAMIESTERGLLVTRFSNIMGLDDNSVLVTGLTRDGLWLIEKGKISKAVKNMRFTESPLFVFNQIEQLGIPVPVFRPVKDPYQPLLMPTIVPPLKSRDFSFTSTADAV